MVQDVATLHDGKPGGSAPKRESRVRTTNQKKIEAVAHFKQNKGMTQAALIVWCFHKFEMKKRLSKAAVSSWFKEGGHGQKAKLEKAIAEEINPLVLGQKTFQSSKFPELEDELFALLRRNETEKPVSQMIS